VSVRDALVGDLTRDADRELGRADAELAAEYPGDRGVRQPVHTLYVPADRYDAELLPRWRREAQRVLSEHGGSPAQFAEVLRLPDELADDVYDRVVAKLATEPIEDLRVDFEDGYGSRRDEEEDAGVRLAAAALARTAADGTGAPFCGVRIKSFEAPTRARGLRTLAGIVGELVEAGGVPGGFVVTLPKVTSVDQVSAMVSACGGIEDAYGLPRGRLRFEIQVETPQSVIGPDGTVLVARMIHASAGRCTGLHYGTYDYSASCGIAAAYQSMEHPAADFAKAVMQAAAAGTGVFVSDGSTNILPVGDGRAVHAAWALHARLVRRSLERGFYQGWDLHPAQLPSRFAATYAFYREGLPAAAARLRAYVHGGDSGYLDEPATAAALAGFLLRSVECGAIDDVEVEKEAAIDREALSRLARRRLVTQPG